MKQIILSCLFLTSLSSGANAGELNQKTLKIFKETFPEAENVTWHETKNSNTASFTLNQITISAEYADNGDLIKTRRCYSQQYLTPTVLMKIKKKYSGREIVGITEISTEEEIVYEITLKDASHWYKVRSDVYGNLELDQKFRRAEPKLY